MLEKLFLQKMEGICLVMAGATTLFDYVELDMSLS